MIDFTKAEDFVRAHWPAALMVTFIVAPSIWTIANIHFSGRIETLELKVKDLTERVAVLDQYATRSREKLVASSSNFSAADLYTPSNIVEIKGDKK